jgi:hypothetical protein
MKKFSTFLMSFIVMLILSAISEKLLSQPEPPHLPDQHGYNGNQSTQSAPLDAGTEVFLSLGIVYLAVKMAGRKRNTIAAR